MFFSFDAVFIYCHETRRGGAIARPDVAFFLRFRVVWEGAEHLPKREGMHRTYGSDASRAKICASLRGTQIFFLVKKP